jgi:hypothetical protein
VLARAPRPSIKVGRRRAWLEATGAGLRCEQTFDGRRGRIDPPQEVFGSPEGLVCRHEDLGAPVECDGHEHRVECSQLLEPLEQR